jgi:cytochrome c-type biogenesis protein CcmF
MLLAWLLLGVGNIIGAWWAYVELGWGGYWAWDPVENAGLMPWLTATAFLHSSIMQRRKGIFRVWTMMLMILTFSLVIFGTFLTRSGIVSSVHTFNDSTLTPYFTVFTSIIFFGSLLLVYYRYDDLKRLKEDGEESIISRESTFLLNNILLVGATLVVLVGTIFPVLSELFRGVKVSLAASFFNKVNGPLFLVVILLTGICTVIGWRRTSAMKLLKDSRWALVAAVGLGIVLFIIGIREPIVAVSLSICAYVLISILIEWFKDVRARHRATGSNYGLAWWDLLRFNAQRYGGYIVHTGIILMAAGIVGSSFYSVEQVVTLNKGDSVNIQRYTVTYGGMDARETPDKQIVSARLSVSNAGKFLDNMVAEKYFHKSQQQPVTEVAIHSGLIEDLYIILEGWRDNGATADFKILVNPLVSWIWAGGIILLLGGLVTFSPDQRSRTSEKLFSADADGSNESDD